MKKIKNFLLIMLFNDMVMKTKIKLITMLAVLLSCMSANAQVSVNGIEVFSKLAKNEVFEKFGQPDEYERQDSGDNGVDERYYYGENMLHFNENFLYEVTICDNRFIVKLYGLERNIAVGDKISALEPLIVEKMTWYEKNWYRICYPELDEQVTFEIIDGIITCICFSTTSSLI